MRQPPRPACEPQHASARQDMSYHRNGTLSGMMLFGPGTGYQSRRATTWKKWCRIHTGNGQDMRHTAEDAHPHRTGPACGDDELFDFVPGTHGEVAAASAPAAAAMSPKHYLTADGGASASRHCRYFRWWWGGNSSSGSSGSSSRRREDGASMYRTIFTGNNSSTRSPTGPNLGAP